MEKQTYQLEEINVTYGQSCDISEANYQTLEAFTQDNGAGKYFVIKTDRWAFDNIEELVNLLNDFKKRLE